MFGKKMRPLKIVTSFSLSLSPSLSFFASTTTPGKRTPRKNNHHQNGRGGEDGGPETTTRTTFGGFVGRKKKNGEEEEEEEEEGHQSRMVGPFARRFRGTKIEFRFRKKRALFFIIALLLKSIVRTEEHIKLTRHDAPFFFFSFLCDDRTPCSRKSSAREMRFESTTTSKSRVVVTVKAFVKRRRRRRL